MPTAMEGSCLPLCLIFLLLFSDHFLSFGVSGDLPSSLILSEKNPHLSIAPLVLEPVEKMKMPEWASKPWASAVRLVVMKYQFSYQSWPSSVNASLRFPPSK